MISFNFGRLTLDEVLKIDASVISVISLIFMASATDRILVGSQYA